MLKFVDLFCGAGFGARGAVEAGAEPLLAIDAWSLAARTYEANFSKARVVEARIEEVSAKSAARTFKPDIILTSPECTSHSIARGAKNGCEKSRETVFDSMPWIEAMRPRWVVLENVNSMKKWDRHQDVISRLAALGYKVNDLFLNAWDFGAPQSRKRMFLICDRGGLRISKDDLLHGTNGKKRTANDVIDWAGGHFSTPLFKKGRAKATLERAQRAIEELGTGVPFLIVYYGSDYAGGWQSIDSPLRTVTTLDRFGLVTWHKNHPGLRMLQPPELAKAMGASRHSMPFGTRREKIKLCGNGVCSPVTRAIFRYLQRMQDHANRSLTC